MPPPGPDRVDVVVGAGLAGLASAARLAKLGHRVVVCERGDGPSGLLGRVSHDGYAWDAVPRAIPLPAVLRDLFRKSGRPLERLVDLRLTSPSRRHVFADGSVLDLPTGSRAEQTAAVGAALGPSSATAWTTFVDGQDDLWQQLRATVLDIPWGLLGLDKKALRGLDRPRSLDALLADSFPDPRLRALAAFCACGIESVPETTWALLSVRAYVERTFGVWQPHAETTATALGRALLTRLDERGVEVRFRSEVVRVEASLTGRDVVLADGSRLAASTVVLDTTLQHALALVQGSEATSGPGDPGRRAGFPWLRRREVSGVSGTSPGVASHVQVTHLGLHPDAPSTQDLSGLPTRSATGNAPAMSQTVLHGDPTILVWSGPASGNAGTPPDEPTPGSSWTVETLGTTQTDVLDLLADRGLDIRAHVAVRLDRRRSAASPWPGLGRAAESARLARPAPGVYCLGTGAVLGREIPYVAWEAAHVADLVGKR